ncbi:MAG: response regulator [Proteobacteria bacterium]|nr:response regulator [Pseudomonadota bacterium]
MPKTLLLADDSVVIQKLVALSFANEDVELITVYNGDDAIAKAREVRPNLVLADVVMPGKNGYEVCEAIKQDPDLSGVPVLLLTGTFEAFDDERAQRAGSDGQITKPFEAQALVERVNELLASGATGAARSEAPQGSASREPSEAQKADEQAPSTDVGSNRSDAYDFFDDDLDPLAAPGVAPEPIDEPAAIEPPAATDDAFTFGDPAVPELEPSDPPAAPMDSLAETKPEARGVREDMTVAIMPEEKPPSLDDARTVTAGSFAAATADSFGDGDAALASDPAETVLADFDAAAPADPQATVLTDDAFGGPDLPEAPAADPMETVLADDLAFDGGASDGDGAAPADDLFADDEPSPGEPVAPAAADDDFEFGFDSAPPAVPEPPPDLDLGGDAARLPDGPELDIGGTSAYDVSTSDLADSFADLTPEVPKAPQAPEPMEAEAPMIPAQPLEPAPTPVRNVISNVATEPIAVSDARAEGGPDLSPVLRDRIHETLEKVAWEAFADLSDTIVRQVLERVESVAWEIIPQMAEALIEEEIRRMKGKDEGTKEG